MKTKSLNGIRQGKLHTAVAERGGGAGVGLEDVGEALGDVGVPQVVQAAGRVAHDLAPLRAHNKKDTLAPIMGVLMCQLIDENDRESRYTISASLESVCAEAAIRARTVILGRFMSLTINASRCSASLCEEIM